MTEPDSQPDPSEPSPAPEPERAAPRGWFTWVPEWSVTGPSDPWAARKGEPRVFALLWCCYLFVAAVLTLFAVRSVGPARAEQFEYGGRALLILVVTGSVVLWPLARLSQVSPDRPVRAALADAFILIATINAVTWPMAMLTRWPWEIAAGLLVMMTSWTLASAGWVAWGTARRANPGGRAVAMLACLLFTTAAPVSWLFMPAPPSARPAQPSVRWELFSPVTSVIALTDSPANLTPRMEPEEWFTAAAPLVLGLPGWLVARRRGPPIHPARSRESDSSGAA